MFVGQNVAAKCVHKMKVCCTTLVKAVYKRRWVKTRSVGNKQCSWSHFLVDSSHLYQVTGYSNLPSAVMYRWNTWLSFWKGNCSRLHPFWTNLQLCWLESTSVSAVIDGFLFFFYIGCSTFKYGQPPLQPQCVKPGQWPMTCSGRTCETPRLPAPELRINWGPWSSEVAPPHCLSIFICPCQRL